MEFTKTCTTMENTNPCAKERTRKLGLLQAEVSECINHFWAENYRKPLPVRAMAMYFFLLSEANRQQWAMPIKCPTVRLANLLNTSTQGIRRTRQALKARGLIRFTNGEGSIKAPTYTLLQFSPQITIEMPSHGGGARKIEQVAVIGNREGSKVVQIII